MSSLRRLPTSLVGAVRGVVVGVVFALLGLGVSARAIDATVTQAIWKMLYNVTDAQISDPVWLAADDDGDGVSNGAEIAAGTNPFSAGSVEKITSVSSAAGNVFLTFPTVAHKQYLVQMSTTLGPSANWQSVQMPGQLGQLVNVVSADGLPKTLSVPEVDNAFYRILVQDIDSDGDGLSDWAEAIAGYDPNNANTSGLPGGNDYTALTAAVAASNIVTVTVVKTNATQPVDALTAPVDTGSIKISRTGLLISTITVPLLKAGSAAEGVDYDALPATVTLPGSSLPFNPANPTVNRKVSEVVLTINPRGPQVPANARQTNVTAIVRALAANSPGGSGNYTLGSASSGSVVINPPGVASGNGLTAAYFLGSNSTYTSGANFGGANVSYTYVQKSSTSGTATVTASGLVLSNQVNLQFSNGPLAGGAYDLVYTISGITATTFTVPISGVNLPVSGGPYTAILNPPVLSRIDPVIDFSAYNSTTNPTGWGAGSNGNYGTTYPIVTANTPSAGGKYCVRWTGQLLPQYSETYTIDFRSDDSAKVWVNGQLLIDRWATQSASDYVNTIALTGGVSYDIQIDYWNSSGAAEAHLYWWSPSQPKQLIPTNRLFPAPALPNKVTPITSSLAAVGYENVPFNFSLISQEIGVAKAYALDANSGPLPQGLSLAGSVITGTPVPGSAGTYNVAINVSNSAAGTVTGSSVVTITIMPSSTGGVTREILGANGAITADGTIPTLDDDTDYGNNVSRRLRGYIVPPKTGNYYFWLTASNAAELWISNDSQYLNRVRRATVTASTGPKTWNTSSTQQTPWISLVAGQKYYFEVLHNTGTISDAYVSMGWCQDDIGTIPSVAGAPNPTGAATVIPNGGGPLPGYPLSGLVPGYIFQQYDYPTLTPPTGKLYATDLGPQGASTTKASGAANIQVNAGETQAILHFNYQNLTSPRTAYHLHVDSFTSAVAPYTVHPQGEIIFDIDEADATPGGKTADGGYTWVFGPTGSFLNAAQIVEAIHQSKVYLNIHTVTYPGGEIRGNLTLINGSQTPPDSTLYTDPGATDVASTNAGAARFLNHATFGASPSDLANVKANGFAGWMSDQLTRPATHTLTDVLAGVTADINSPYPSALFTNSWWKNSITAPDQLRQRLAFALSEIMVVSWANDTGNLQNNSRLLASYYDQLVDNCLPTLGLAGSGTFRGVLKSATLTPGMGLYLDMRANQKGDDSVGRHPNENYAREIMQLFSVGVYRLWDDGSYVLDSNAGLVATYAQPQIQGLAALFTGWNFAQANQANGRLPTNFSPAADYLNPMVLVPTQHEVKAKILLNNVMTPAATGLTPRVNISNTANPSVSIAPGNPCTVYTATAHGLSNNDTVVISGVTSGTFNGASASTANIDQAFTVTVTSPTSFTVPVNCTVAAPPGGTVTGATVRQPTYASSTLIPPVTGSQADNTGTSVPHPYDQFGLTELDRAIDNIVNNDNVPPYVCRQLIQRFVTSDPSPGYLYRVVQKFKDNGSGVRGDLSAVIKQVLLDGEARSGSVTQSSATFGKQREPVLRLTGPARAFPATSYSGTYTQLTGVNAQKLRIVTSAPNSFNSGFAVSLNFQGNYTTTSPPNPYTNPTSATYSVAATLGIAATASFPGTGIAISNIATGNPCTVNTTAAHGLSTGDAVTITGLANGTFSPAVNNGTFQVTVLGTNSFTVASNCTVAPTGATGIVTPYKTQITTTQAHGLSTGNSVTISGVSGGSFTPSINGTFSANVIDSLNFQVPVKQTTAATSLSSAQIAGANTLDVADPRITNVSYSQPANSNLLTVSTGGPQTNVVVPVTTVNISSIAVGSPCTVTTSVAHKLVSGGLVSIAGVTDGVFGTSMTGTFVPTVIDTTHFTVPVNCTIAASTGNTTKLIRSRVYLMFLTQTTAGGAAQPADGIYDVQTTPTSSSFTVATSDTPTTARGGNVLVPKLGSSYTPISGNTVIQFNNSVNHNMLVGQDVWVDAPVINNQLSDGEYTITQTSDEDHFQTSYLPANLNGGTYSTPSGSTNGVLLYPLVPPALGRSGVVSINQSTFVLGSTEATLTQSPLNSPTVFNFFFPNYKFPGQLANAGLDAPEFQLTTDTNVMNLTNSLTNMVIGTGGGNGNVNGLLSFSNGSGAVVLDIGNLNPALGPVYLTAARTADAGVPSLVDDLATLLIGAPLATTGDPLYPDTRTAIINFVANTTNFPYTLPTPTNQQMRDRVRAIIHLIITSPEYAVQK